jgi:hypothetical protein
MLNLASQASSTNLIFSFAEVKAGVDWNVWNRNEDLGITHPTVCVLKGNMCINGFSCRLLKTHWDLLKVFIFERNLTDISVNVRKTDLGHHEYDDLVWMI